MAVIVKPISISREDLAKGLIAAFSEAFCELAVSLHGLEILVFTIASDGLS